MLFTQVMFHGNTMAWKRFPITDNCPLRGDDPRPLIDNPPTPTPTPIHPRTQMPVLHSCNATLASRISRLQNHTLMQTHVATECSWFSYAGHHYSNACSYWQLWYFCFGAGNHNDICWQCLVPTSTFRFTRDVGYRMTKAWIWLYKEITFMNNDI